jgi:hypothetical protein
MKCTLCQDIGWVCEELTRLIQARASAIAPSPLLQATPVPLRDPSQLMKSYGNLTPYRIATMQSQGLRAWFKAFSPETAYLLPRANSKAPQMMLLACALSLANAIP